MRASVWEAGAFLLITAASGLILVQANRSQGLRQRIVELRRNQALVHEGLLLPTLRLRDTQGKQVVVGERASPGLQLILVMGADCAFSRASLPFFRALADSLGGRADIDVIGVLPDSLPAIVGFAAAAATPFGLAQLSPKDAALLRVRALPTLILADEIGIVRHVRFGTLTDAAALDSVLRSVQRAQTNNVSTKRSTQTVGDIAERN